MASDSLLDCVQETWQIRSFTEILGQKYYNVFDDRNYDNSLQRNGRDLFHPFTIKATNSNTEVSSLINLSILQSRLQ